MGEAELKKAKPEIQYNLKIASELNVVWPIVNVSSTATCGFFIISISSPVGSIHKDMGHVFINIMISDPICFSVLSGHTPST